MPVRHTLSRVNSLEECFQCGSPGVHLVQLREHAACGLCEHLLGLRRADQLCSLDLHYTFPEWNTVNWMGEGQHFSSVRGEAKQKKEKEKIYYAGRGSSTTGGAKCCILQPCKSNGWGGCGTEQHQYKHEMTHLCRKASLPWDTT
eukprot:1158892-Pelagomonas_calceolata.AAC.25